jgi:MFS family permease
MSKKRISLYTLLSRTKGVSSNQPLPPTIKRIFALSFMSEFIVIYPFYVIMFGQRGGISAAGIGMLLAIWMIVSVLAEVPTGVIADKMPKKWSLVFGRIMQLATFVVWLFAPNFIGYLTGFIIWGIGEAFLSGAFQAYMYEALDEDNKKAFGKIYSRSSAFTMLAYTMGSLLAFIIGPHYSLLLVLSIAVSVVSLWITLSLPKTHGTTAVEIEAEVKPKVLLSALRSIRDNPLLHRILLGAVLVQGLMGMLGEYMPAYYQQVGTPTQLVALFMSISSGAAALLYWWMHHIEAQLTRYQLPIIGGFTLLFTLSFMGGAFSAVFGLFLLTRILRLLSVNNETQIQHHAPNESRATLGSLYSFIGKLLSAALVSLVGFFAVANSIVTPIRWSVIFVVIALMLGGIYFSLRQKNLRAVPEQRAL